MSKIDRQKAQSEFNRLVSLIEKARSSEDADNIEIAARASAEFISALGGREIAKYLMTEAAKPLPSMQYIEQDQAAEVGSSEYVNRGLSRLVLMFSDVLDAAYFSPEIIARDLIEMSRENGSNPHILAMPQRKKGHKNYRDLKYIAKKRVAKLIYYEASRTNKTLVNTFHILNETSPHSFESDRKNWDRIAKTLTLEEREQAKDDGAKAASEHPDVSNFKGLWQRAVS